MEKFETLVTVRIHIVDFLTIATLRILVKKLKLVITAEGKEHDGKCELEEENNQYTKCQRIIALFLLMPRRKLERQGKCTSIEHY
jgi:hypothetical protein